VLAIAAWLWLWSSFSVPPTASGELQVKYLEQYISVAQVIVAGVFVSLVSVIIQFMLPEARDRFEQFKESRLAYSRAKTAVLYLPDRVANSDQVTAFVLVEEAHRALHLAETFEDVMIKKGYLHWFENPKLWILYNYWQIVAVAEVLRARESRPENRKELRGCLEQTLGVVHRRFGERGEGCKGQVWVFRKEDQRREPNIKYRFDEEDHLKTEIRRVAGQPANSVQQN
jgi:hypothetical protein